MNIIKKKICIIGIGYIGLPTAAMFAAHGYEVVGVDVNPNVVSELNKGKIVIEEPHLDKMVFDAVNSGNLTAKTQPEEADAFIISVPTPINKDKTADMRYVTAAAESIVPYLKEGNIVVLESTSPPRTVEDLILPILKKSGLKIGEQVFVAHSPERVLPGRILIELVENEPVVRLLCNLFGDPLAVTFGPDDLVYGKSVEWGVEELADDVVERNARQQIVEIL